MLIHSTLIALLIASVAADPTTEAPGLTTTNDGATTTARVQLPTTEGIDDGSGEEPQVITGTVGVPEATTGIDCSGHNEADCNNDYRCFFAEGECFSDCALTFSSSDPQTACESQSRCVWLQIQQYCARDVSLDDVDCTPLSETECYDNYAHCEFNFQTNTCQTSCVTLVTEASCINAQCSWSSSFEHCSGHAQVTSTVETTTEQVAGPTTTLKIEAPSSSGWVVSSNPNTEEHRKFMYELLVSAAANDACPCGHSNICQLHGQECYDDCTDAFCMYHSDPVTCEAQLTQMINQNCLGFASTGALVSTAGPISTVGVIVAAACAVLAVALVGYFVTKAKGTRRGMRVVDSSSELVPRGKNVIAVEMWDGASSL